MALLQGGHASDHSLCACECVKNMCTCTCMPMYVSMFLHGLFNLHVKSRGLMILALTVRTMDLRYNIIIMLEYGKLY